jgi:hypothetical protein
MTDTTRQVLDMLATGKITTEEADRLIDALRDRPHPAAAPVGAGATAKARYLRVIVESNDPTEGPIKINVRVPLQLLRAGVRLASLIPVQAQERVNQALREQGVDIDITKIKPENINELIDELRDLSVDVDQPKDAVKIRVFTE